MVGDGAAADERAAQIAVRQLPRPVGEALHRRAVQPQRGAQRGDPRRVGVVPRGDHGGVAGERLGEDEDQDRDGRDLPGAEQQSAPHPAARRRRHASRTLSNLAQSRVLAGASAATPRSRGAWPTIQSAKPHTSSPPSSNRRRCIRS